MNQRSARPIDQRDHPLSRLLAVKDMQLFAVKDMQLSELTQVPPHVGKVQAAGPVHPQPDLGHQPHGRVARPPGAKFRQVASPFRYSSMRRETSPASGGIRSAACLARAGSPR